MSPRIAMLMILMSLPAPAVLADDDAHFAQGEVRAGLMWDNLSAMETGVLKFGGTAGVYVANGVEVGFEQQFIVPPNSTSETRSWGYIRAVPFRDWWITPFLSARAGYYSLPEQDAAAVGVGFGAVMFVDKYFAFEATLYHQLLVDPRGVSGRQTELDWRLVLYY